MRARRRAQAEGPSISSTRFRYSQGSWTGARAARTTARIASMRGCRHPVPAPVELREDQLDDPLGSGWITREEVGRGLE